MGRDIESRIRNVTAVLGPTNTGKTHLAIERMTGYQSGIIGLPLRLLAREVYDKVAAKVGADNVALVTGEEKIKPENPRYWVATVEAMPLDVEVEFVAVDEVQLAADPDRGHVFTDRILNARGTMETLLLGAQTMHDVISDLIPGANFISRPRLSKLNYIGQKKITRIPTRSAVIAFAANDVYSIAELVRRQRGGTAVVLGALSPRTRNAQVELYQSGDVDFLVATDAIGMGLNLDVDHVAFTALRKFDGIQHRDLHPAEIGQIAGRAGRHMNDGTFGVTGDCPILDADVIEKLETHNFDSVRMLQWRSRDIELSSLDALKQSLREAPREARLARARLADDEMALEAVSRDQEIVALSQLPGAVEKLWDVCQIPDYRKISHQNHAELVASIFKSLTSEAEVISEDWFADQVAFSDRVDGDIDTLSTRLAHIRTWTYVANRADWLKDPKHWQGKTREIEDRLSDALHERLTQRFVDERTSALMRGMREKAELSAEVGEDGYLHVENHSVGRLQGFRFQLEGQTDGVHARALKGAAAQVLSRELAMRVRRVVAAKPEAFTLDQSGTVIWQNEPIAELEPGEDPLRPSIAVLCDEHLSAQDRDKVKAKLENWLSELIADKLKPLLQASTATDVDGLAKGVAFQLREHVGVLNRGDLAREIKSLDQPARAQLRKHGVRFGAFNIYFPSLMKPAPSHLASILWMLKYGGGLALDRRSLPALPRAGLTSVAADETVPAPYYRAFGYHLCGPRAVRIDILERLADMIRPLVSWRAKPDQPDGDRPAGSSGDGGFIATPDMMSILGCSSDDLGAILTSLGFEPHARIKAEQESSQNTAIGGAAGNSSDVTAPDGSVAPSPPGAVAAAEETNGAGPKATSQPPADASSATLAENVATPLDTEVSSALEEGEAATEIVWRPKRRQRTRKGQHQNRTDRQSNKRQTANRPSQDGSNPKSDSGRHRHGDTDKRATPADGRGGGKKRRDKRPARKAGPKVHQSRPPAGGLDSDNSPFAALSELRDALAKSEKQR